MLHDFPPHEQNHLTPPSVAKTVIYQLKPTDKEKTGETAIPASLFKQFSHFSKHSLAAPSVIRTSGERMFAGNVYFTR